MSNQTQYFILITALCIYACIDGYHFARTEELLKLISVQVSGCKK